MIDRDLLRILRAEIDAALAPVADKHKVTLKTGNASFEATRATFKLEVAARAEDGSVINPHVTNLKQYGHVYGITPEMAGKSFRYGGSFYTLTGLDINRPKRPIVAARVPDGKTFIFTSDVIDLIQRAGQ